MRNIWAVCWREFKSYFITPVGYIIVGTYSLISGLGFTASFLWHARATQSPMDYQFEGVPDLEEFFLSPFMVFCAQLMLFIGPLITMRLLAEERNRGTIELLLTHPLRDREIIFGKYLASLLVALILMVIVGAHLATLLYLTDVEPAVLLLGLLAVFLVSAAFLSMGLFISALSRNQITAATLTFAAWFVMFILGNLASDLPATEDMLAQVSPSLQSVAGPAYSLFRTAALELPMDAHAAEMAQGVLRPQDIAYYVLVIAFFLFLTFRAFETRKWRA